MNSTMRWERSVFGVGALVLALACGPALGQGQQQAQPVDPDQNGGGPAPGSVSNEDLVTLNFVNADIQAVIKAVGEMTGRNFLIDPRVQGTVNIVAPRAVPRALV